ncbi:SRPBCC family protein [Arthrobacter sp. U41]|uniref:SRPBCC family protein n=1 Tax=Arthrobacter sp. U41 TaxID=1849032 RepID=UPI0008594FC4|nr:SRPBCC family protein [Arthrobacter sp. U41]AOT02418.1 polyketide cyclase [Arthrobacter sp. U41]
MTFSVSRRVAAPVADVWALLTDTAKWPAWGPSITGVEPATAGALAAGGLALGSRGKVRTVLGASLPYTVTAFEPGRYWSWSVAGFPATGHQVIPQEGGCLVTFTVPWWAPVYLPVCALALRRIERLATRQGPMPPPAP